MQDTKQIKYPYARLTGISQFMDFVRAPEWRPDLINVELLKRLDISPSKERETLHAIKFLGVVDEKGLPTVEFDNLKRDYAGTMRKLVAQRYKDLLKLLPTNMINQSRLVKFFGLAADTSEYQAKLFAWFCEQAGIELPNLEKHFHRSRFDKKRPQ